MIKELNRGILFYFSRIHKRFSGFLNPGLLLNDFLGFYRIA